MHGPQRRAIPRHRKRTSPPTPSVTPNRALRNPDHLVRLQRQAPFGPLEDQRGRSLQRRVALLAIHRLDEEVIERPAFQLLRLNPLLRSDQLELSTLALDDLGPRLWADTDPVEARDRGKRAVGLDRDAKATLVQRSNQCLIELEHRLPARTHHQPLLKTLAP